MSDSTDCSATGVHGRLRAGARPANDANIVQCSLASGAACARGSEQ